jgi:hypothetical protein
VNCADTLAKYRAFAAEHGFLWIPPAPLVNSVDHRAFNYSLEEPILREFGSYTDITHYYTFSTIQPCIRSADVGLVKKGKSLNHLALFHIFPTAFHHSPEKDQLSRLHTEGIVSLLSFLGMMGLNLGRLQVTYFSGGVLAEISHGHVPVKKLFPPDDITPEACLKAGLSSHQLRPVSSLDTFVATFAGDQDFLAGNRFEFYYPLADGALLEIATGESLGYRQIREKGITKDILPVSCCAVPIVVGLERLHAIMENCTTVNSISAISELAHSLKPVTTSLSVARRLEAADFFRAAHLLLAQTHNIRLNENLSEQRRVILAHLCNLLDVWAYETPSLKEALELNAVLHPWLPELKDEREGVLVALTENIIRRSRRGRSNR